MKTTQRLAISAITAALTLGMIGCSGMSQRDQSTAAGAGIGAVGAALLGLMLFGESANPVRLACIALIVAGVVGLKLSTPG